MIKKQTVYESEFLKVVRIVEDSGKTFEICERKMSFVGIIAITDDEKIILVNEKRYPFKERIFALPSGAVDGEKDLEKAAQRELQEEAGFKAGKLEFFMRNKPSIFIRQTVTIFVGRDLKPSLLPRDEDEDIEVEYKSLEECVRLALDGNFRPDLSALAILRFKDALDRGVLAL